MDTLAIDIETYSDVSLPDCGVHRYAASEQFEILLFAYSLNDEPTRIIDLASGEKISDKIMEYLTDDSVIKTAYNAAFERNCINRFFGLSLKPEGWRCTLVQASMLSLPLSLEGVGEALNLDKKKMSEGKDLIRYFCMPCKPTKVNGGRTRNLPSDAPEKWELFKTYCIRDVDVEKQIRNKLTKFPIPDREQELYCMDQRINDRGIMVDQELIGHAVACDLLYKETVTKKAFDVAVDMVDQCPALKKRIKPVMSVKRLVYKPTNSFYQVLSAEAYTKHGLNVHAVIFDELHAQPNRELFDVMTKGSGDARTQPLFFLITTAGTDRNSVCFEQHQKALDIIEGRKIDPTFYPVIYGASDEDDWSSEDVWYKANPSLGYTIDIEKVQNAYISAKENAAEENVFRQLRLNQWVKQSTRWMQMDKWDACSFAVNEEELLGRECYGGLDLSSSTDITAFVLVFPPRNDTEKYVILPYFWIPEDNMRLRVRRDHVPYDVWAAEGCLKTTEGNVIHYGFIEQFIDELGTKFHIKEIAFDRWGAVQMVQNLEGMGFTVVPFGQGYKDMSPPTKELMKLTLEERIAHGGHKVLRWMMDNVFVRQDPAGNIKMDKEKSTEKIDGAVATVMALDRAIRNEGSDGSVYDDRGILVF